jgi:hypothetical protein
MKMMASGIPARRKESMFGRLSMPILESAKEKVNIYDN